MAPPTLMGLGIAGATPTVATVVVAGVVFGLVVAAGALLAVWNQRRQRQRGACTPASAQDPVDLEFSTTGPGADA